MNTKSDHQDLLQPCVWGFPVYVLDPKLQNDQKIPRWNCRACLGQFLGFSDEHCLIVANIRVFILVIFSLNIMSYFMIFSGCVKFEEYRYFCRLYLQSVF